MTAFAWVGWALAAASLVVNMIQFARTRRQGVTVHAPDRVIAARKRAAHDDNPQPLQQGKETYAVRVSLSATVPTTAREITACRFTWWGLRRFGAAVVLSHEPVGVSGDAQVVVVTFHLPAAEWERIAARPVRIRVRTERGHRYYSPPMLLQEAPGLFVV